MLVGLISDTHDNLPMVEKAVKRLNPEHVEKIRRSSTGRRHTDASRFKMSSIHKGVPKSEEHKRSLSMALSGKKTAPCSDETKAKISAANKASWARRRFRA